MTRSVTSGAGAALLALLRGSPALQVIAREVFLGQCRGGQSAAARALGVSRASAVALAAELGVEIPNGQPGRPARHRWPACPSPDWESCLNGCGTERRAVDRTSWHYRGQELHRTEPTMAGSCI